MQLPGERQLGEVCKGAAENGSPARVQAASGHGKSYQETEQAGFTHQACNVDKRLGRLSLAPCTVHSWSRGRVGTPSDLEDAHCVDTEQHSDGDAAVAQLLLAGSRQRWLCCGAPHPLSPGASTVRDQEAHMLCWQIS